MFFENAFKTVSDLVQDFKENENHFLSHSYSEADVRNDFIKIGIYKQIPFIFVNFPVI